MTMYLTIECDRCGEDDSDLPFIRYAVQKWREEGWRIGRDRDETVCPDCRTSRKGVDRTPSSRI